MNTIPLRPRITGATLKRAGATDYCGATNLTLYETVTLSLRNSVDFNSP